MAKQTIRKLIYSAVKLRNNYNFEEPLLQQCHKHAIFDNLDLKLNFESVPKDKIGIKTLFDFQEELRISLYYLPTNKIMKLHDHKQIKVISYVVMGEMIGRFYTHQKGKNYSKKTVILKKNDYSIVDGDKDNLHEFQAKQNTIFLDIIFPDYKYYPCKFYKQIAIINDDIVQLQEIEQDVPLIDV